MLSYHDIFVIIALCITVNLIQPTINELCFNLFKKLANFVVGWLLKHAVSRIPIKKHKIKNTPATSVATATELLQAKGLNIVQEGMPIVIDIYQKKGIDGIFNLVNDKLSTFFKPISVTAPITDTVQVEDITDEANELQQYRLTKITKGD
jgi:hypothetical protein